MQSNELQSKASKSWKSHFLEFLMVFLSEGFRNLWADQEKAKQLKIGQDKYFKERSWHFCLTPSNPKENPITLFGGMICFTNL